MVFVLGNDCFGTLWRWTVLVKNGDDERFVLKLCSDGMFVLVHISYVTS